MLIYGPGWFHEDDTTGEPSSTPYEALRNYILHVRGNCDDDSDERDIQGLNGTVHRVGFMEEKTLKSEDQREAEMVGLDDDDMMSDVPIGGKYFIETRRVTYVLTVSESGDENGGEMKISYKCRVKE